MMQTDTWLKANVPASLKLEVQMAEYRLQTKMYCFLYCSSCLQQNHSLRA